MVQTMIIPAAGYGTRMREIAGTGCKELLPVGGRPAIQYALEEALAAGISNVGIVIREGKEEIRDFILRSDATVNLRKRLDIHFLYQRRMNGECGAILAASDMVSDRPFLVHYPDNIVTGIPGRVTGMLLKEFGEVQGDILALSPVLDTESFASARPMGLRRLRGNLFRLSPDEIPVDFAYGLRTTGVYLATAVFMDACRELVKSGMSVEIKDRDAYCLLAARGCDMHGVDAGQDILDTGSTKGYTNACDFFRSLEY